MSGIYIPGMEMPKSCWDCGALHEEDYCYAGNMSIDRGHSKDRAKYCPLIEVPDHGRLIDADKIGLTDFEIILCQEGNPYKNALKMLLDKIERMPTIIPADKEGEE